MRLLAEGEMPGTSVWASVKSLFGGRDSSGGSQLGGGVMLNGRPRSLSAFKKISGERRRGD